MIETQIIKSENQPIAVILDYKEYLKLKELAEDKEDYYSALEVKYSNKEWINHEDLKNELGLD